MPDSRDSVERYVADLPVSLEIQEIGPNQNVGRELLNELNTHVEKAVAAGKQPVILTSGRVRNALHRMIEPVLPHVAVLSFAEIATGTPVTSVGTVRLNDE